MILNVVLISTVVTAVPILPPVIRFPIVDAENTVEPELCKFAIGALVPIQSLLFVLSQNILLSSVTLPPTHANSIEP